MRDATIEDFELAYSIYMDDSVHPHMFHPPMTPEKYRAMFERHLKRGNYWVFQDDAGQDCAMASAMYYPGRCKHVAEIQALAIHGDFQGKGLGKKIIEQLINRLTNNGAERIQLYVEADNVRAINAYSKLGFKEEGRMKNFFKRESGEYVDEVVMGLLTVKQ